MLALIFTTTETTIDDIQYRPHFHFEAQGWRSDLFRPSIHRHRRTYRTQRRVSFEQASFGTGNQLSATATTSTKQPLCGRLSLHQRPNLAVGHTADTTSQVAHKAVSMLTSQRPAVFRLRLELLSTIVIRGGTHTLVALHARGGTRRHQAIDQGSGFLDNLLCYRI